MKTLKLLLICTIVLPFLSSCGYNTMVEKQEAIDAQWAQVENVYQRRNDLIPNIVNTVKGYAQHEENAIAQVTDARAKLGGVSVNASELNEETLQKFQEAQDKMGSAISRLLMVQENYPDLKANENFLSLQAELEGAENRITVERKKFNEVTQDYNTYIKKFPHNIIASWFDFVQKPYFKASESALEVPKVEF